MLLNEVRQKAETLEEDLRIRLRSADRFATGETQEEIRQTTEQDGMGVTVTFYAPKHTWALEFGRGPTRDGAPKGNPTLVEQIEKWMTAKGLVGSPWPIAQKIHKEGYEGTPGLITGWRDGAKRQLKEIAAKAFADELIAKVRASSSNR